MPLSEEVQEELVKTFHRHADTLEVVKTLTENQNRMMENMTALIRSRRRLWIAAAASFIAAAAAVAAVAVSIMNTNTYNDRRDATALSSCQLRNSNNEGIRNTFVAIIQANAADLGPEVTTRVMATIEGPSIQDRDCNGNRMLDDGDYEQRN